MNEKRHKKCGCKESKNICLNCTLRSINDLDQLKQEFPELKYIEGCSLYKGDSELPEVGQIVDVNSKRIKPENYQVWEKDGKKELLVKTSQGEIKCVGEAKKKDGKQVLPHNIIILHKSEMKEFLS